MHQKSAKQKPTTTRGATVQHRYLGGFSKFLLVSWYIAFGVPLRVSQTFTPRIKWIVL